MGRALGRQTCAGRNARGCVLPGKALFPGTENVLGQSLSLPSVLVLAKEGITALTKSENVQLCHL